MSGVGDEIIKGLEEALDYAKGRTKGVREHKVTVPAAIDARAVRKATGLSQAAFCARFGFSLGTLRDWEQGRRRPDGAARVLLLVIAREPDAVDRALLAAE